LSQRASSTTASFSSMLFRFIFFLLLPLSHFSSFLTLSDINSFNRNALNLASHKDVRTLVFDRQIGGIAMNLQLVCLFFFSLFIFA
jgi:glycosylphosphatidylinositol transamidase (GPIT) subunit GPI8